MENVRKITFLGVLSWVLSIIFFMSFLGALFSGEFFLAIVVLIMGLCLFPPANRMLKEKMNLKLSRGLKVAIIIIGFGLIVYFGEDIQEDVDLNLNREATEDSNKQSAKEVAKKNQIQLVSEDFSDYEIYCDDEATSLQKEVYFDENLKSKYVKWTGEVRSVSDSFGSYNLQIRHCDFTFSSDILIKMKDDQKSKLLQLNEGDDVTYIARLKTFGEILGLSADKGEIV